MNLRKLRSTFAVGCLTCSLAFSSVNFTYAADPVKNSGEESAAVTAENSDERADSKAAAEENPDDHADAEAAGRQNAASSGDGSTAEQIMCYADGTTTEDPKFLEDYLSEDSSKPQEAIMLTADDGVKFGDYQLNHDQVKILNINQGNITINADTYTQENGETNAPWDAKSDAYLIRGKGSSPNNITIASPQTKVTIYLEDLEWNGTITYTQNTDVELVICGQVINNSNFLTGAKENSLIVKGLTPEGNSISVKSYFFKSCFLNKVSIENLKITGSQWTYGGAVYDLQIINSDLAFSIPSSNMYCNNVVIDHSKVTNIALYRSLKATDPAVTIRNQSVVNTLWIYDTAGFETEMQISDSIVDNIRNMNYSSTIISIYKLKAKNSVLTFSTSPVTSLEADKCTIEVQNNLAFKNLIANSCSIKGKFSGTPTDFDANDLYLKMIRLREHPNEYVYVSVDGGEKVKLLTDLNGCLYPYVKEGSSSIAVTTEDGASFGTSFDPIKDHDENVTILTPGGSGGDDGSGGAGGGTVTDERPEINDNTLTDQYLDRGDPFTLTISAKSKTAPSNLSYQWYKDGKPIEVNKAKKKTYSISIAKAEHAGVYCCYVTDNNNNLVSKSKEVVVTLNIPVDPAAPVILSQSSDMELVAGSSVTLSVSARPAKTGSSLDFQWYKGTEALDGETSRVLTLSNVRSGDAGSYHCLITDKFGNQKTESSNTVIKVK